VTEKSGTKYSRTEEVYYVLKNDRTVRDGLYQLYHRDKLSESGYYKNGQKDSVWETYGYTGQVLSRRWYADGQKKRLWEFFTGSGQTEFSYDFATGKATYPTPPHSMWIVTDVDHRSDSGSAWVHGQLDKPLFALVGNGEWLSFLNRTLRYPDDAVDNALQGRVEISVTVDTNGRVTEYGYFKTASPSLDAEAMRTVKLFPLEFVPAEKDGKKVSVQFHVPIIFRVEQ
jgi:TonB family protein